VTDNPNGMSGEEHALKCRGTQGIGLERIVGQYHTLMCSTCGGVIWVDERGEHNALQANGPDDHEERCYLAEYAG
jgi:hypothetical protein